MEKKKSNVQGELNIAFQQFELTVKDAFIFPEKIPFNRMRDAYYNLNKGRPQDQGKAMGYSDNSTQKKNDENLTDKDKTNNELTLKTVDIREKSISDKNSKNKSDEEKVLNFVKFGQHRDFSFFESYAREIIFQLFNYHKMFFYKYDLEKIMNKEKSKTKTNKINESGKQESKKVNKKTQEISTKKNELNNDNVEKLKKSKEITIKQKKKSILKIKNIQMTLKLMVLMIKNI